MDLFSFTLTLRVEVPDLYKGLLSCDFTTEDSLEGMSVREQGPGDKRTHGKNLEHCLLPSEHSTTAMTSAMLSTRSGH